jgi:hypothetical protein
LKRARDEVGLSKRKKCFSVVREFSFGNAGANTTTLGFRTTTL